MIKSVNIKLLDLFHGVGVEGVLAGKDFIVNGLFLLGLEGVLSKEDGIAYNPQGPYINFVSMADGCAIKVFLNHLGSNIVGSSAKSIPFSILLDISSEPKITDLDV